MRATYGTAELPPWFGAKTGRSAPPWRGDVRFAPARRPARSKNARTSSKEAGYRPCAKKLLHETLLPVTEIAFAAGFGSVRRFNEAFLAMFERPPSAFRRVSGTFDAAAPITVNLAYRPPIDWAVIATRVRSPCRFGCFTVDLPLFGPEARASFSPGRGHNFRVCLGEVPLGGIGAALALLKREILGSESMSGKPWGRADSDIQQDGTPLAPGQ